MGVEGQMTNKGEIPVPGIVGLKIVTLNPSGNPLDTVVKQDD
jgi:hypothetical protein